jgi:hypothetical protein
MFNDDTSINDITTGRVWINKSGRMPEEEVVPIITIIC